MPATETGTGGKLPKRYREALQALKDQAKAVASAFDGGPRRKEGARLADARKRIARLRPEVNAILTALARAASVDRRISVPTVSEKDLAVLLGRPERAPRQSRRH